MLKKLLAVPLLLLWLDASAAQGEICKTPARDLMLHPDAGGVDNQAKYDCPSIGQVTIPEVYSKGWRVVAMHSYATAAGPMTVERVILIEKLP
jgi:hypothetical protein